MDGRWNVACRAIGKAMRLNTDNSTLRYHAGVIAMHFGDAAEAKRQLHRTLDLNAHFDASDAATLARSSRSDRFRVPSEVPRRDVFP